jgi:hypothetical protein
MDLIWAPRWGGGGREGSPGRRWRGGASRGGARRPLTNGGAAVTTDVGNIGASGHKSRSVEVGGGRVESGHTGEVRGVKRHKPPL